MVKVGACASELFSELVLQAEENFDQLCCALDFRLGLHSNLIANMF